MKTSTQTQEALKIIRAFVRKPGTKMEIQTRLATFPTTKAAVNEVLSHLGEVCYISPSETTFSFEDKSGEGYDTRIALHPDSGLLSISIH